MPATYDALVIVLLFVLPGLILSAVYNANVARPPRSDLAVITTSIAFSVLVHLSVYYWTSDIYKWYSDQSLFGRHLDAFALWVFVAIFVLPILIGRLFSALVEMDSLQRFWGSFGLSTVSRTTQAWDYFFQQQRGCWMIITLKSGPEVGGRFDQDSFAALTPGNKDVYIEEVYEVKADGTFGEPLGDGIGMWVNGSDITKIEFFKNRTEGD